MEENLEYQQARALLLEQVGALDTERIPLEQCGGRVLAEDIVAGEDIPPFDRSPYDGYAFRAADTAGASADAPAILRVLEEIPAGGVSHIPVTAGTAVRVMTGAPIPLGADAVVMYEKTHFTQDTVAVFQQFTPGTNIVRAGEDVRRGEVLARRGMRIDPGLAGTLASLGIGRPAVYRLPRIGILSTGSELVEVGRKPEPGQIRNANRYALTAAVDREGWEAVYLGAAGDDVEEISRLVEQGLSSCDAVISTGGVSAGDFDLTPAAMERAGVCMLFQRVAIKPGMSCAYGVRAGKPVCALSGNPASALTNFYVLTLPALRKLAGYCEPLPAEFPASLEYGFGKASPAARFLRGRLEIRDGRTWIVPPGGQGNVVLSSTIGCDMMAEIPAGSGPVAAGTELRGFML